MLYIPRGSVRKIFLSILIIVFAVLLGLSFRVYTSKTRPEKQKNGQIQTNSAGSKDQQTQIKDKTNFSPTPSLLMDKNELKSQTPLSGINSDLEKLSKPFSFVVNIASGITRAHEGVVLTINQEAGTEIDDYTIYRIPAGFDFASGSSFANGAQIGNGTFTATFSGSEVTVPFVILNDQNLQGHKLHFKLDFSPQPVIIDVFLDGDVTTGHKFEVDTPEFITSATTPLTTVFNFSGILGETPLLTNPPSSGNYTWEVEFHFKTSVVTKSAQVIISQ